MALLRRQMNCFSSKKIIDEREFKDIKAPLHSFNNTITSLLITLQLSIDGRILADLGFTVAGTKMFRN